MRITVGLFTAVILLTCILTTVNAAESVTGNTVSWTPSSSSVERKLTSYLKYTITETATTYKISCYTYGKFTKDNVNATLKSTSSLTNANNATATKSFTYSSSDSNSTWTGQMGSTIYYTWTKKTTTQSATAKAVIKLYNSNGTLKGTSTATKSFTIPRLPYLDINWSLDGVEENSSQDYGTCDVYINGEQVANDVSDFKGYYAEGTSYEITDIRPTSGYKYTGKESYTGTMPNSDTAYRLTFETITDSTVTFNANGGTMSHPELSGTSVTVSITPGSSDYSAHAGFNSTYVYREGYTFCGFYTAEGDQIYDANGQCVNDGDYWSNNLWQGKAGEEITFYARWQSPGTITITKRWNDDLTGDAANNRTPPVVTIQGKKSGNVEEELTSSED